jgi:hypothetical protein
MTTTVKQWFKHRFRSDEVQAKGEASRDTIPETLPPYRADWPIIPTGTLTADMGTNYGLFRHLPVELRRQILGHAFGNQTLHVDLTFDRLLICRPSRQPERSWRKPTSSWTIADAKVGRRHCSLGSELTRNNAQPKQWLFWMYDLWGTGEFRGSFSWWGGGGCFSTKRKPDCWGSVMMMGQVMTSVMVGLFIGLEFNTP